MILFRSKSDPENDPKRPEMTSEIIGEWNISNKGPDGPIESVH